LGSLFAGVKAGTVAGVIYIGGLAIFNLVLLYVLKADFLSFVSAKLPLVCPQSPAANMTGAEDCFAAVTSDLIPPSALFGYLVALVFAGVFGAFYESFPGKGATWKGETLGAMVGVSMFLLGLNGIYFDEVSLVSLSLFLVAWTVFYGFVIGRLYVRYTRLVEFGGQGIDSHVRIIVDGKDNTGKTRTFAAHSVHRLRAEMSDGFSFKEWTVSGGVSIEDPRDFQTEMEVTGNGVLKAQGIRKN
jgi:hypothetical protein